MAFLILSIANPIFSAALVLLISLSFVLPADKSAVMGLTLAITPLVVLLIAARWLEGLSFGSSQQSSALRMAAVALAFCFLLDLDEYYQNITTVLSAHTWQTGLGVSFFLNVFSSILKQASLAVLVLAAIVWIVDCGIRIMLGRHVVSSAPLLDGIKILMILGALGYSAPLLMQVIVEVT